MVYTPLVPAKYSITVNGKKIPIDPAAFSTSDDRGTIVDSGTTLVYLPTEAYDPFVSAIAAAASPLATNQIRGKAVLSSFLKFCLNFAGDVSMHVRPADYLWLMGVSEGDAMWCVIFGKSDEGSTILGDLVLKDKIIVYDLA
ncbi:hypothetical protein RND71_035932 [Anisodus tanguticus]|uniref:Peptidase A1 domain-containing protein n=1 Tax=Anisodus tanguticus TaxID=243964 RepID=A0AAE1R6E7_9SOLA|nr:hypothetical protein RND71_035932 [Anisodus tanguticus]